MLNTNNLAPATLSRSRRAFALIAATLLIGGSISEASAKSRHHRHHSHQAKVQSTGTGSWLNANASIGSTGGRSFAGKASIMEKTNPAAGPPPVSASTRTP